MYQLNPKPFAIKALMCLALIFHDVEDDGSAHNYLVHTEGPYHPWSREYLLAFSSDKDASWRDGCYQVEATCTEAFAIDEPFPADADLGILGYPRLSPVCDPTRIEGDGFHWQEKRVP